MLGIVYITAENMENASQIARELVSRRLAACVNMFPVSSIYRWKEEIEEANEIAMFVKTDSSRFEEITRLVKSLHIVTPIIAATKTICNSSNSCII